MVYVFALYALKAFVNSELASCRHLCTPKFYRTVVLAQKGAKTIVLASSRIFYASDFCMDSFNDVLKFVDVCLGKLKMPNFIHFPMYVVGRASAT